MKYIDKSIYNNIINNSNQSMFICIPEFMKFYISIKVFFIVVSSLQFIINKKKERNLILIGGLKPNPHWWPLIWFMTLSFQTLGNHKIFSICG